MPHRSTTFLLLAVVLLVNPASAQTQNTTVPLNKPLPFSQAANTYSFYQTTVTNPTSQEVLMITVSADVQAYVGIFISTSASSNFSNTSWPNWNSYTQQCFYSSLDTCALRMPDVKDLPNGQTNLIVYFTITVGSDCLYMLDVSLQTIYPVTVGGKYTVTFAAVESAIVELPGSTFMTKAGGVAEQIVVECLYYSYKDIGRFQLIAQQGQIPNPQNFSTVRSKSLNAFTQVLELAPPQSLNSSYFILLQGQNGTKFNFTIRQVPSISNPTLTINQSISYLSPKQIAYTYHSLFVNVTQDTVFKPLVLEMYLYRGYGKFMINYCNGLHNFTFESIGGESGEIMLTSDMRKECYGKITSVGGLLVENLEVGITDIVIEVGYTIGLYEGIYDWFLITGMKEIGILETPQEIQTYDVAAYGNSTLLTLTAQVYVGNATVIIVQCTRNSTNSTNCTELSTTYLTESVTPLAKINFTCEAKQFCQIRIQQTTFQNATPSSPYCKYSLYLAYTNKKSTELLVNSPQYDLVQMNAYNYYYINVSALRANPQYNFSNATVINVRNTLINGQTVLLASASVQFPIFKDIFKKGSDVVYGWDGTLTYLANQTYPESIYIGVMGDTESIYHLQYTLNTTPNIPAAYQNLIDDADNNFVLTQNSPYILLKYISHIVPYTITFNPMPNCIKYGTKLPIENGECVAPAAMPNNFTDAIVYFNVSQSGIPKGGTFKFDVFVGSGQYGLEEDRPILIACQRQCYQIVNVKVTNLSATVLHSGDGKITLVQTNQTASNGPLTLVCPSKSCVIQLNATLRYGGSMELAFESSSASEIEWRTKPITLPSLTGYKRFYMQIPKWTDFNSIIFYAQAADLTVYYNIQSLNENYTNTINYQYPSSSNFMGVSYGDPLQQIHVVDIDPQLLQNLGCQDWNIVCVLTFAVTLNQSVEYSRQYIDSGYLYYSSNIYQYDISSSWPILKMNQSYSVSYFSHAINFATEETTFPYTIHLQALSNCRPQIQTESSYYSKNFYTDTTLPPIMPGQSKINFRVVSNEVCMYSVALTNAGYELVFADVLYGLETGVKAQGGKKQVVVVYQHSDYREEFIVQVRDLVDAIIVSKIAYTKSAMGEPTLVLPTQQTPNVSYSVNTTTLKVTQAENTQYIIVVQLASSYSHATIPLIIRTPEHPITLLHNQQQQYVYDPTDNSISAQANGTIEYEYYSTSNFYIFMSVSKGQVRVTVRDATVWGKGIEVASMVLTNSSQPWVYIDGNNNPDPDNPDNNNNNKRHSIDTMTKYLITYQFLNSPTSGSKSTLKLHIEEVGTAGLMQLYEGVSIYDAFVHQSAMNCYRFTSPMVLGQDTIDIDLNFMDTIRELEEYNQSAVASMNSLVGATKSTPLFPKLIKISPTTYRLTLSFLASQNYRICFTVLSPYMVGTEYSLVINVPSMPMIYNYQYIDSSTIYSDQYAMFEYINYYGASQYWRDEKDVDIVMTVVNCVGESVVLGAASYGDMLTGKMTTVSGGWSSNGISSVLVDVPHGYYYFGVKPTQTGSPAQLFRINVQQAPLINGSSFIPQTQYSINWHLKASLETEVVENVEWVVLKIPPVIRIGSVSKDILSNAFYSPVKIVYSLYLLTIINDNKTTPNNTNTNSNSKNSYYKYSIDAYTRCPALYNYTTTNNTNNTSGNMNTGLKPVQIVSVTTPYLLGTADNMVVFRLTVAEFKKESNISVKAQVFLEDESGVLDVIQYFYGQEEILVLSDDTSTWKPLKWIFYLCLVIMALGGLAFAYRFYMKKKAQRTISFEMSDNTGREMEQRQAQPIRLTNSQPNNNTNPPPIAIAENGVSSNRRPLNNSVGYGEFIDEV